MVNEPTVEDTISILRGLKERYEVFHGVKIQDQALIAAATLSNRYITDRFLPDKAIDLVDEACAMIRSEMDSMPAEMDELNRKIMRHEIEEAALKKETDTLSQEHLADIQKELADLRRRLKEKQLDVELTDSARSYIVDAGYDPVYGARPLKRFIQSKVETLIARKILSEDLHHGSVLTVDYDGHDLFVTTK